MHAAVVEQLQKCARRFHEMRRADGSAEHKYWRFEDCPGPACVEAKKALGMPEPPELDFYTEVSGNVAEREPGAEG